MVATSISNKIDNEQTTCATKSHCDMHCVSNLTNGLRYAILSHLVHTSFPK
jgi:hypothetical protein